MKEEVVKGPIGGKKKQEVEIFSPVIDRLIGGYKVNSVLPPLYETTDKTTLQSCKQSHDLGILTASLTCSSSYSSVSDGLH